MSRTLELSRLVEKFADGAEGLRARIAAQEQLLAERDAQIQDLMELAFVGDELRLRFGITPLQYRVLVHLIRRSPLPATWAELLAAIYPRAVPDGGENTLQVALSRLRKALAPHGVRIETLKTFGCRLNSEDLARLRAAGWGMRS